MKAILLFAFLSCSSQGKSEENASLRQRGRRKDISLLQGSFLQIKTGVIKRRKGTPECANLRG